MNYFGTVREVWVVIRYLEQESRSSKEMCHMGFALHKTGILIEHGRC